MSFLLSLPDQQCSDAHEFRATEGAKNFRAAKSLRKKCHRPRIFSFERAAERLRVESKPFQPDVSK